MSRPRALIWPFLAVLLVLAACRSSDSDSTSNRKPTAPPAAQAAVSPAAIATQAAAPTRRPRPSNPELIISTTTSTVDSGLLDVLQPMFEKEFGYKLTILSQGSGAALKTGERGEADVVLAHSPAAEVDFMNNKHGVRRELVMHNDFVIVGPASDPAKVKASTSITDAMQRIANAGSPFISRGDNSGTHVQEQNLWKAANISPAGKSWYQESGSGMGQTLLIASDKSGYTLTDRSTYLAQKKNLSLDVVREKDASLLNIYHVIQVDPAKSNKVNGEGAKAFIDWLVSPAAQKVIGEYGVDTYGQALFVPDYGKEESKLGS